MQSNRADVTRGSFDTSGDASSAGQLQDGVSNHFRMELASIFGPPGNSDATSMKNDTAAGKTDPPVLRFDATPGKNDAPSMRSDAAGKADLPAIKITDGGDKTSGKFTPDSFDKFARNNGLNIKETPDKKLEFSLNYNGEKVVISNVEISRKGFENIQNSLREYTNQKQSELQEKYGIKFAGPADARPRQRPQGPDDPPGKELEVRKPKLRELLGLESALEKGALSGTRGSDMKPVTFYFLKNDTYAPGMQGAASYDSNINGGPAVIVDPGSLDRSPVTERDRTDGTKRPHLSIESIFIHELGHHSEQKVFSKPGAKDEFYKRMGWTPIPGTSEWMLKGEKGGFAPSADGNPDAPWEKIGNDGSSAGTISRDDLLKAAKVKPATDYFEGPHEVLAEGLTMLRLGGSHRDQLRGNKALYRLMKEFDQKEIDLTYGKGKFIRSYNGMLVPNTPANAAALRRREQSS